MQHRIKQNIKRKNNQMFITFGLTSIFACAPDVIEDVVPVVSSSMYTQTFALSLVELIDPISLETVVLPFTEEI